MLISFLYIDGSLTHPAVQTSCLTRVRNQMLKIYLSKILLISYISRVINYLIPQSRCSVTNYEKIKTRTQNFHPYFLQFSTHRKYWQGFKNLERIFLAFFSLKKTWNIEDHNKNILSDSVSLLNTQQNTTIPCWLTEECDPTMMLHCKLSNDILSGSKFLTFAAIRQYMIIIAKIQCK